MAGHPRFREILDEMIQVHDAKNHDYSGDDPLSNLKECEQMGIPGWKGTLVRMTDKMSRLKNYAKNDILHVKTEGIRDTLIDMANYSILALILFEESHHD